MIELTTKEAVEYLLNEKEMTKYGAAKALDVSVSSINQWLGRTKASEKMAKRFAKRFDIKITDVYEVSWRNNGHLFK